MERAGTPRRRWTTVAALLMLLACVAAVELLTPREVHVILMAGVVPVLAALLLSLRDTVLFATLTWGVIAAVYATRVAGEAMASEGFAGVIAGSSLCLLGVLVAQWDAERQTRLERARSTAEMVQLALLRPLPLRTALVDVYGIYLAADEYARVGGDLYEVIDSPFGTRLLIGDVRGKGLEAVNAGSAVLSAFRVVGYEEPDLVRLTERMESMLDRYNRYALDIGQEERHVTALLVEYSPQGRVSYVNCGHLEPFVSGAFGAFEIGLGEPGLPLGLGGLIDEPGWQAVDTALPPGASLVLVTDGVTETRGQSGDFYPLAQRLRRWSGLAPAALARTVARDLVSYAGGRLQDDAAILVVHPQKTGGR
ncbi:PP2C family protein-serine/threonine phosphatase [Streptomyces melanogenes]|uniref:PP2C family protein-serine/threonine phosphatase n=1 Tax=Streptomyces melanogenes TaxID=67326 RepID=UPI00167CABAF|nr:PP2C family protein-serine/threonine phosphatase [Streptomyces melanogenes]GGP89533.1 hypothetical protein GCM10010278_80040 [Streptomyces melanogenes]